MQQTMTLLQKEWKEWNIVEKLGQGSYGTVYSAKRESYGFTDWSAIKHISIPGSETELNNIYEELGTRDAQAVRAYLEDTKTGLIDEYRQMIELQGHTNIVACHDVLAMEKEGELGYDLFIRMELLESVSKRILDGRMNRQETLKLGIDICKALMLLEEKKIVHRDIKPQNIFVNDHGDYKLGDFGTARSMAGTATLMSMKGTVAYMPPEIMKGEQAGYTADIYSLGLVMYRLMNSNKTPFMASNQTSTSTMAGIAHNRRLTGEELPLPSDADQELGMVILKACAFDPKDRWQSAREFCVALEELQNGTYKKVLTKKEKEQILKETAEKEKETKRQQEQIQAQQEKAKENKKKKTVRNLAILIAAVVVLGVGALFAVRMIGQNQDYQAAADAFKEGKLEEALAGFEALEGYKDAAKQAEAVQKEMASLARYQEALNKQAQKDYTGALEIYRELNGYKDAKQKINEINTNEREYKNAKELFIQGKYTEARDAFEKLGSYADAAEQRQEMQKYVNFALAESYVKSGQLKNALTLFKDLERQGFEGAARQRANTEKAIADAALYDEARAYEAQKEYALAREIYISLGYYKDSPQKAEEMERYEKYYQAEALYKQGEYEKALAIYEELEEFNNASQRAALTRNAINQRDNQRNYQAAQALEKEKKYQEALEIYAKLGNYLNSAAKKAEMQKHVDYADACELYAKGEYAQARDVFEALGSFGDAQERLKDAKDQIQWQETYRQAREQENNGQYKKAQELYRELGSYQDAAAKAAEMQLHIEFENAKELAAKGTYERAREILEGLGDFEDARDWLVQVNAAIEQQSNTEKYTRAQTYEAKEKYEDAYAVYAALGSFRDSADKALEMSRYMQYEKAQEHMDNGEYEAALAIYKELGKFENAQSMKKTAETAIENKNNYARAQALEKEEKYADAMILYKTLGNYQDAAQKAQEMQKHLDYASACALFNDGKYEEAQRLFEQLGAFKDTFTYLQKTKAQIDLINAYKVAENLENAAQYWQAKTKYEALGDYRDARAKAEEMQKYINYELAQEHMDAGEYEQAVELYKALGNFYDSAVRLGRAEKKLLEVHNAQAYREAQALEAAGKYQAALDAYAALGAYENAGEKALEMKKYVDYQRAEKCAADGQFEEAIEIFKGLGSFRDSAAQIKMLQTEIAKRDAYQKAADLEKKGKYAEALKAYNELSSYKDARAKAAEMQKYLDYIAAGDLFKRGEYEKALKAYQALGEFKDSAKQAQNVQKELKLLNAYQQAQTYEKGEKFQEALKAYEALGNYKNSAAKVSELKEYIEWLRTAVRQPDGTYVSLVNGDNLLSGSLEERKSEKGSIVLPVQETLKKYVGMPVTISFEAMALGTKPCEITVNAGDACGISITSDYTFKAAEGTYRRFSFTTETVNYGKKTDAATGKSMSQGMLAFTAAEGQEFAIQKVKIEVGKKATAWTFAPHDPLVTRENLLVNSASDCTSAGGFLQVPVRDALENYVGLPVVVSFEAKSNGTKPHSIQVYTYQSSGIGVQDRKTFHLSSERFQRFEFCTTVKDYLYKVNANSGQLYSSGSLAFYDPADEKQDFTIRKIKLEVGTAGTAWTIAPNDPMVTGENLLVDSAVAVTSKNSFAGYNVRNILADYVGTNLPITVSFEAMMLGDTEKEIKVYSYQNSGISIADSCSFMVPAGKYERFSFVTTARDYGIREQTETEGMIGFYDYSDQKDEFEIRRVKIEIGSKATEWSFSPQDSYPFGENLLAGYALETPLNKKFLEIPVYEILEKYEGLPVSISFEAKAEGNLNQNLRVYAYQSSGLSVESSTIFEVPTDEYQKFSWNTTVKNYGYKNDPNTGVLYSKGGIAFNNVSKESSLVTIRKVKIEIGVDATEFTYAPDDALVTGENMVMGFARERQQSFVEVPTSTIFKGLEGLPVTISFEAKAVSKEGCELEVYPYQNSGLSIAEKHQFKLSADQFQQFAMTSCIRDFGLQKDALTGKGRTAGGIAFYDKTQQGFVLRKLKIELGTEATEWSFAPNDPLDSHENLLVGHTTEANSRNGFLSVPVRETLEKYVGLPVTVSFEARTNGTDPHEITLYAYQNSGISVEDTYSFTPPADQFAAFSYTTTVKDYGYRYNLSTGAKYSDGAMTFYDYADQKADFTIRKLKIEIGDTFSEFSFAPNDPLLSGDNLLPGYAMEYKAPQGFLEIPVREVLEKYAGLPVTISFDAKSDGDKDCEIQLYAYQNSGVSIEGTHKVKLSSKQYQRYTIHTTVKDFGYKHSAEIGNRYSSGSLAFYDQAKEKQPFSIQRVKIEIGEVQKGVWSLAPKDAMITGENLFPDSARARISNRGFLSLNVRDALKEYVGMPVTISFSISMRGPEAKTISVYAYQESGISIDKGCDIQVQPLPQGMGQRVSFVATVTDYGYKSNTKTGEIYSGGAIAFYDRAADKGDFVVQNIKIEVGTKATPWSLAPADQKENAAQ